MGNTKENSVQKILEAMDRDEKFATNEALKKVIQETHDKKYKENEMLRNARLLTNNI
jgi:hypothetical protein